MNTITNFFPSEGRIEEILIPESSLTDYRQMEEREFQADYQAEKKLAPRQGYFTDKYDP